MTDTKPAATRAPSPSKGRAGETLLDLGPEQLRRVLGGPIGQPWLTA
jgi:hypothetical protein